MKNKILKIIKSKKFKIYIKGLWFPGIMLLFTIIIDIIYGVLYDSTMNTGLASICMLLWFTTGMCNGQRIADMENIERINDILNHGTSYKFDSKRFDGCDEENSTEE